MKDEEIKNDILEEEKYKREMKEKERVSDEGAENLWENEKKRRKMLDENPDKEKEINEEFDKLEKNIKMEDWKENNPEQYSYALITEVDEKTKEIDEKRKEKVVCEQELEKVEKDNEKVKELELKMKKLEKDEVNLINDINKFMDDNEDWIVDNWESYNEVYKKVFGEPAKPFKKLKDKHPEVYKAYTSEYIKHLNEKLQLETDEVKKEEIKRKLKKIKEESGINNLKMSVDDKNKFKMEIAAINEEKLGKLDGEKYPVKLKIASRENTDIEEKQESKKEDYRLEQKSAKDDEDIKDKTVKTNQKIGNKKEDAFAILEKQAFERA